MDREQAGLGRAPRAMDADPPHPVGTKKTPEGNDDGNHGGGGNNNGDGGGGGVK